MVFQKFGPRLEPKDEINDMLEQKSKKKKIGILMKTNYKKTREFKITSMKDPLKVMN